MNVIDSENTINVETLTLTPTPYPIMMLNDSMDYNTDEFVSTLKRENDNATYLNTPVTQIKFQPDKKNRTLIRLSKLCHRSHFRKSFVTRGVRC